MNKIKISKDLLNISEKTTKHVTTTLTKQETTKTTEKEVILTTSVLLTPSHIDKTSTLLIKTGKFYQFI